MPVIAQYTGIDSEKCREFFTIFNYLGYGVDLKKRLKTSAMLMRNREAKIQASLFVLIYQALGKQAVYQFIERSTLEAAFALYREMQAEMDISPAQGINTINDAWSIACELRDKKAYIRRCRTCHLTYFTTHRQHTTIDCPFCPPKNKHRACCSHTQDKQRVRYTY